DTSLLGFLAIFLPAYSRTGDAATSAERAIPLLFICICTFVANDLDDVDKDRVNHPDRPLPSGVIPKSVAVVIYFVCLGLALLSTKNYIADSVSFWYYGLIILSTSYGYVVESLPSLKAPYVAVVATIPIIIVAFLHLNEPKLYFIAGAVFLMNLGREICMDIRDRPGDAKSFVQRLNPSFLTIAAFAFQMIGLCLLSTQIINAATLVCVVAMTLALVAAGVAWIRFARQRLAILLMKSQFFIGLYLLM
ncbi:MAG: UbiA family prenyltransferase, partial [Pyrinomonadaceae bacterium]